jgi:hypothetical protein
MFDSFAYSAGVLFQPIVDTSCTEYTTLAMNLPTYTRFGFRLFKVIRLNIGGVKIEEKGTQDFSKFSVIPTVGMAFELNLWLAVKRQL